MSDMRRTQAIDGERERADLAEDMKRVARYGYYTGRLETRAAVRYFRRCCRTYVAEGGPLGTRLIFTRDSGMHECGWWKNPQYNQCLHLSLSFFDLEGGIADFPDRVPFSPGGRFVTPLGRLPQRRELADPWIELFYGDWKRLLWAEPPYGADGKAHDVWHYRVFTDPTFTIPLLPMGEVYSRRLIEAGWKSWSDLRGEAQEAAHT
jgi:hypothetical protein